MRLYRPAAAQLRRWVLIAGLLFGLFTLHVLADHDTDSHAPAVITSTAAQPPAVQTPQPDQPAGDAHLLDDCILFLAAVSSIMALGFTAPAHTARRTTAWLGLAGVVSAAAAGVRLPRFLLNVQRT